MLLHFHEFVHQWPQIVKKTVEASPKRLFERGSCHLNGHHLAQEEKD